MCCGYCSSVVTTTSLFLNPFPPKVWVSPIILILPCTSIVILFLLIIISRLSPVRLSLNIFVPAGGPSGCHLMKQLFQLQVPASEIPQSLPKLAKTPHYPVFPDHYQ